MMVSIGLALVSGLMAFYVWLFAIVAGGTPGR
jgi:hypothetical protein